MRALGIVVALIIAAGAVMLYVRTVYLRPWQSRRNTERLLRENEELDRQLERLRQNDKEVF